MVDDTWSTQGTSNKIGDYVCQHGDTKKGKKEKKKLLSLARNT